MACRSASLALPLVLLLVASAGPAARADRVLAEHASSPARSDGAGTVAWIAAPGALQLADGRGSPTASVDLSGGCVEPPEQLDAVGGGQLLFTCTVEHDFWWGRGRSGEPRLLDLATRAVRVPAGAVEAFYDALDRPLGSARFEDVGLHGVRMWESVYHGGEGVQGIDWRSGASMGDPVDPAQVLDVDAPGLVTTLCAPLRRTRWDIPFVHGVTDPPPLFDPFLYAPPYGVAWGLRSPLVLRRCGRPGAQVLEPRLPHDRMLRTVALAGGTVAWLAGDYTATPGSKRLPLRAYLSDCGARVQRPVTVQPSTSVSPQIALVRDGLVLSELTDAGRAWRISRLSLAGVCRRLRQTWSLGVLAEAVQGLAAAPGSTQRLVDRGLLATRLQPPRARTRLTVRAGSTIRLLPGTPAHAMRWRLGAGRWHRIRPVDGWRWTLRLPDRLEARSLGIRVRTRQGGELRFAAPLVVRG